jgi:hypothetical protein
MNRDAREEYFMSIFERVKAEIESFWEKDSPTIEAGLKAALKSAEPIWKTSLGSVVLSTVSNLQIIAASGGTAVDAEAAAKSVALAAVTAGVTAKKSAVSLLVQLAIQKLEESASALGAAPTPLKS